MEYKESLEAFCAALQNALKTVPEREMENLSKALLNFDRYAPADFGEIIEAIEFGLDR